MALYKQRRLRIEKCESRTLLSANGLAMPAAELRELAVQDLDTVAVAKLDEAPSALPGDFNTDGVVDGNDFLLLQVGLGNGEMDGDDFLAWQAGYVNPNEAPQPAPSALPGDFNTDGVVDGNDFLLLQVGLGNGEMDGDDFLAWQAGYVNPNEVTADELEVVRAASQNSHRAEALTDATEKTITKRSVLATDAVMETWPHKFLWI